MLMASGIEAHMLKSSPRSIPKVDTQLAKLKLVLKYERESLTEGK